MMASWDRPFDEWSHQDFYGTSSTSDSSSGFFQSDLQSDLSSQAQDTGAAIHSPNDQRSDSGIHTSSISSKSIGSEGASHTPYDGSSGSFASRRSAPRAPTYASASASLLSDPILVHLASYTPSEAPASSLIGQIASSGSLSSSVGSTESDETDSQSTSVSSATSDASHDADHIFVLDPDHHDHAARVADQVSALRDLELPEEYRDPPSFYDPNDDSAAEIYKAIHEILNEHTKLQARVDVGPWTLDAKDGRRRNPDECGLALPPSLAYNKYHAPLRHYRQIHQKIERRFRATLRRKFQPTSGGPCDEPATGTPEWQPETSPYALAQYSLAYIESQGKRSRDCHNSVGLTLEALPQPRIHPQLDCRTYSVETFVSIFHPSFLVSHLSPSSVSTLTNDLYGPEDLVYDFEHDLGFDLGFGPPIDLKVCTFTPRDTRDLLSYQKHKGKDVLNVEESLPLVLNEFPVEAQAGELDTWLDGIIDSESGLPEYVKLMMLRQNSHPCSQLLEELISWYMASRNKLSGLSHEILRSALKLLITTTLLSLVTQVTNVPESLLNYLSSHYPTHAGLSTTAPRLLTRQIKASLYYLQQHFLLAVFSHFIHPIKLPADVKIAVAFLVAYVLDLVRNAGRGFAEHSRTFNPNLDVSPQAVMEYETIMQEQLFGTVQASVGGAVGRMSGLVGRWKHLDSILKGKQNESDEYRYVVAILEVVRIQS